MNAGFRASAVAWLNSSECFRLPHKLAVGWSGGADSTALLLALKVSGYDVVAWHVDHGWRESSGQECEQLAAVANDWQIPFFSARMPVPTGTNCEAKARAFRLNQFQLWSREQGIKTLCLGHQREDQAETVCMRLLQGAGSAGCRGMRPERQLYGMQLLRPLLHISGLELREALKQAGIGWFEDPSNRDMRIWRNRIRFQLFPKFRQAGVEPVDLFLRWQRVAERTATSVESGADQLLRDGEHEGVLLWASWADSSPAVRARALQRMMVATMGEGKTPGRRHIEMVEQWTGRSGRGGLDLSGCRLQRRKAYLHLLPTCSVCAE